MQSWKRKDKSKIELNWLICIVEPPEKDKSNAFFSDVRFFFLFFSTVTSAQQKYFIENCSDAAIRVV